MSRLPIDVESEQAVDGAGECGFGLGTHHAIDRLAVSQEDERGDRTRVETARDLRVVVDIDLDDLDLALPAYRSARRSSTGATMRHGPHHGAQRSTSTSSLVLIT